MNRRQLWAIAGVGVVFATAVIAASNLHEIYQSQKDFVIGSLLSLAGFCFGKAVNRTQEERAQWLQDSGASADLAKLDDTIHSAAERLSEYYWRLNTPPDLVRVALEDLNKATAYASSLRHELGVATNRQEWQIPASAQVSLDCIRRDLHEAINRLYQTRDRLVADLTEPGDQGIWDVFDVLTTDLLKANRSLDSTRGAHTAFPPHMHIESAANYLRAASQRAAEVGELMSERGVDRPATFEIMCRDLSGAIDGLTDVNLPAMAAYQATPTSSGDTTAGRSFVSAQPE